ncbi:MAG: glycoside hydrolase family 3 N-terminal domain-containing protein, partial [Armatimonadota bacterium]
CPDEGLDPDCPHQVVGERVGKDAAYMLDSSKLRGELGWDGLIVTDCLEMKGVADRWGTPEAAVMAVKAGVDCPLICHTLSVQRETHKRLMDAVASGELSEERLDQSVVRILHAKEKLGILESAIPAQPHAALEIVSDTKKRQLALEIARHAVTVARNEDDLLPVKLKPDDSILVVSLHPTLPALTNEFRKLHPRVTAVSPGEGNKRDADGDFGAAIYPGVVTGQPRSASDAEFPEIPEGTALIVAATCPSEPWTKGMDVDAQARLVEYLNASKVPLVVLALREPYDIVRFPDIQTYICLYGYRREQLQAAAEEVLGITKPTGSLPVLLGLVS